MNAKCDATPDVCNPGTGFADESDSAAHAPASAADGADLVQRVAQGAHASIDQLQRGVQRGMDQARVSADQWSGSMREVVREHPLSSVGVAFILGAVFARLLR